MSDELDMPQPLSRVRPKAKIIVSTGAIAKRPEEAALVMRVVATWADIDSDIAIILSKMMNLDVTIGIAMYQALSGGVAKRAAFLAAANAALKDWELLLLHAVLDATKASRSQRNDFVHHLWAMSPDLPGPLLLMPPTVAMERHLSYRVPEKGGNALILQPRDYDYSKVMVYRLRDFQAAAADALSANMMFWHLYGVLGSPKSEQARRQLLSEPRVQQALQPRIPESDPRLHELLRPPIDGEPTPKEALDDGFGFWIDEE